MQKNSIKILKPFDFHVHFRKGEMLDFVAPLTANQYGGAIIMPNTTPEIFTVFDLENYYTEIKKSLKNYTDFKPLMTLYFNNKLTKDELIKAKKLPYFLAVKLYLKGVTTNSNKGIENIENSYDIIENLQKLNIPLLIHGEVTNKFVDVFDREKVFVDTILLDLVNKFPALKIVMEHITTKYAAEVIEGLSKNIASTITPHHLIFNRNNIFDGGIKPHNYCLPILKREEDRKKLVEVATSGNSKFFAGTDSAPHHVKNKESECGCAGIFNAFNSLELYTSVFDKENKIENLEKFVSLNGAKFYEIPLNEKKVELVNENYKIPYSIDNYNRTIQLKLFMGGEEINWRMKTN